MIDFTDAATGVAITVPYKALPEGVKPEDVTITVTTLSAAALAELNALLGEENELLVAYDIVFRANGAEFEPADMVNVMFPLPGTDNDDDLKVYHVTDDNAVNEVSATFTDGVCEFGADAFSTYIVLRGNRDGGTGFNDWVYPPANPTDQQVEDTLHENLRREFAYYYDPTSANCIPSDTLLTVTASLEPHENVQAGQTITLSVDFRTAQPEYYSGPGVDSGRALYDKYRNAELVVKLPNGLKMPQPSEYSYTKRVEGDFTYYTISLGEVGLADQQDFNVSVYVMDNGTANAIQYMDLTGMVTYSADLILYDRYYNCVDANGDPVPLQTYNKQTVVDGPSFWTVRGPGSWGVDKTAQNDDVPYANMKAGDTFTLNWAIDVGILDNGHVVKMDTTSAQNSYSQRTGITPISSATLTDSFYASYVGKNGATFNVMPDSVTIKKDSSTAAPTPMAFVDADDNGVPDGPVTVNLTGDLAINKNIKTDCNGDGSTDNNDPDIDTWTSYTVTATFTVTEDMVADYPENTNYVLTGNNSAATSISFVNVEDPDEDDTDVIQNDQTLPALKPAKLVIKKFFTDYTGDRKDYSVYGEGEYGPIFFTLTRTDNEPFFVYTYDETDGYQPTETTAVALYDNLARGDAYYFDPDVEYKLSENIPSTLSGDMVQVPFSDGNNYIINTPAVTPAWEPEFENRETKGKITINKKSDNGTNLQHAVFTLTRYTDAAGTQLADSIGTHANPYEIDMGANSTFNSDALPYGYYTLVETTPPPDHSPMSTTEYTYTEVSLSKAGGSGTYTFGDVFEIDDTHHSFTYNVVNKRTSVAMNMKLFVGVSEAEITNMATNAYSDTCGVVIKLYRKVGDGAWEQVTTAKKNGEDVNLTTFKVEDWRAGITLPAFDNTGATYTYKFEETIPAGYYDPQQTYDGTTDRTLTQEFDLVDAKGKAESE